MSKGDEVTIYTNDGRELSGTIRTVLTDFLVLDDESFRPKIVGRDNIKSFSSNS